MEEQFTFFYKTGHPFSQWYRCSFELDGIAFNCAEQYMMYAKALLFDDVVAAQKILVSRDPGEQKAFGRLVAQFDEATWNHEAKNIVYRGNLAKFSQNVNLKKFLLQTGITTLVEASRTDVIWGIGLPENDPDRFDRSKWNGTNWLGEVLMAVRHTLLENKSV